MPSIAQQNISAATTFGPHFGVLDRRGATIFERSAVHDAVRA